MARYRQFGQHCLSLGRREQTEANAVQAPGYASVQSHAPHLNSFGIGICLDLDWLDEELFASCSADKVIHVLSVNHPEPIAVLTLVFVLSV